MYAKPVQACGEAAASADQPREMNPTYRPTRTQDRVPMV